MYKYLLESVDQMNWMAIVPLILFFIFFVAIIIRTWKTDDKHIDEMSQLPLEEE